MNKKALGGVIAVSLLIVVSVASVVSFQGWFQTYSGNILNKAESDSEISVAYIYDILVKDSSTNIYMENPGEDFIVIDAVEVNSNSCSLQGSDVLPSKSIMVLPTDCVINESGAVEVVVFTQNSIIEKELFIR